MGAWGSGLYANDTTCDIQDSYMQHLQDQLSNQEAYEKTLKTFSDYIGDSDEEPLFWYALADTQWKTGRLMPEVKQKALEWIEKGGGMELWEESKSGGAGWQKTLNKLKKKLLSEQPKEKKIRKRVPINQNPWKLGDVYAYRFHDVYGYPYNTDQVKQYEAFDKYMVLQKMGEAPNAGGYDEDVMKVHVFDKLFCEIPALTDLEGVRLLPLEKVPEKKHQSGYVDPNPYKILSVNCLIYAHKKKNYPTEHLIYLGNMPPRTDRSEKKWNIFPWFWASHFARWTHDWQGIEYETHEEGVFKYTYPE